MPGETLKSGGFGQKPRLTSFSRRSGSLITTVVVDMMLFLFLLVVVASSAMRLVCLLFVKGSKDDEQGS